MGKKSKKNKQKQQKQQPNNSQLPQADVSAASSSAGAPEGKEQKVEVKAAAATANVTNLQLAQDVLATVSKTVISSNAIISRAEMTVATSKALERYTRQQGDDFLKYSATLQLLRDQSRKEVLTRKFANAADLKVSQFAVRLMPGQFGIGECDEQTCYIASVLVAKGAQHVSIVTLSNGGLDDCSNLHGIVIIGEPVKIKNNATGIEFGKYFVSKTQQCVILDPFLGLTFPANHIADQKDFGKYCLAYGLKYIVRVEPIKSEVATTAMALATKAVTSLRAKFPTVINTTTKLLAAHNKHPTLQVLPSPTSAADKKRRLQSAQLEQEELDRLLRKSMAGASGNQHHSIFTDMVAAINAEIDAITREEGMSASQAQANQTAEAERGFSLAGLLGDDLSSLFTVSASASASASGVRAAAAQSQHPAMPTLTASTLEAGQEEQQQQAAMSQQVKNPTA
ncbi:MAG: hypothetical protein M1561_00595 [Gammaproteobacteria bacterium]|nr:hypothetical protein [Gammaproteobacteria bacterium]